LHQRITNKNGLMQATEFFFKQQQEFDFSSLENCASTTAVFNI